MSTLHRGLSRIALSLSIAALAAMPALAAPQPGKPVPAAVSASAPLPAAQILPVPLRPVVPAAQRVCNATTASGLGTAMLKDGAGAKPGATDYVLVNYIGYLAADGTVFDQNVSQAFRAAGVIKGFSEGLQLMNKGSIWRFCIPAALGYGDKGTGPIPANADLVFQVELVDFKTENEIEAMRAEATKQAEQQAAEQQAAEQQAAGQEGAAGAAPAAKQPNPGAKKPKK